MINFGIVAIFALHLQKTIDLSKIHDFADDTNFLYENPTLKGINRKSSYYMSRVTHWLTLFSVVGVKRPSDPSPD